MNLSTFIVLLIIAVCAFFAIKRVRAKGGCSCGHEGGCSGCPSAKKASHKNEIDLNKKMVLK